MNLSSIYSTPLWHSEYPEFEEHKEIFLNTVKEYKEQNPTGKPPRSNVGGYQSPIRLHKVEELRPLFEYICQMAFKASADMDFRDCDIALTSAWLNINDSRGCINVEHIHADVFSGVFYLKAPEKSGKLSIINPGMNGFWMGLDLAQEKNCFTSTRIKLEPQEGNIILFPSYLPHSVEPNEHDEERISIAFNVIALPKGSIEYPTQNDK